MSDSTLKSETRRFLIAQAREGAFFRVRHEASGAPIEIDPQADPRVVPATNIVNEIGTSFESDRQYGRDERRRRASWQFEQHLGFNHEVDSSLFEEEMTITVPRIPRSSMHNGAAINLSDVQYAHPTTDAGSGGSSLVLIWEVVPGR